MKAKHPPGPWTMYEHRPQHATASEFSINARCAPGQGYASEGWFHLVNQVNGGNDDECRANARLIAAAPELLEALQNLLTFPLGTFQVQAARAAIAKATGSTA